MKGRVLWLFGPSGAGKTTLAHILRDHYFCAVVLDGDHMRATVSKDLGFSVEDRMKHLERMAHITKHLSDSGVDVICAFITPTEEMRNMVICVLGNITYVWCNAPSKRKDSIFVEPLWYSVKCNTRRETVSESIKKIRKCVNEA